MQVQVRGRASGKEWSVRCSGAFSLGKHCRSAFRSLLMRNGIDSEYKKVLLIPLRLKCPSVFYSDYHLLSKTFPSI
jgi:hypothetical protein